MKTLIITLVVLSLTFLEKVAAISLSPTLGDHISNSALSAGTLGDRFDFPDGDPSFITVAASTSPINQRTTISASSWNFTNTADQAVWSGQQTLINDGAVAGFSSYASVSGAFRFLLYESVNYSVTGDLRVNLGEGAQASTFAWIEKRNLEMDGRWDDVYQERDLLAAPFGSIQFGDSAQFGTSTGVLDPGSYYLSFASWIRDGEGGSGYGNFAFTFTPVPDGGSTLMLLGLALGAIGIWRCMECPQ